MALRTGTARLPLHHGRAPRWLFDRMVLLAREVTLAFVGEHGPDAFLDRLSDPYWFQAFGCALGFDWHSSGVTTTVCGALKLALRDVEADAGVQVAGGKGMAGRRTPQELARWGQRHGRDPSPLIHASRMSAKVDSACVQDGFQIYHHAFVWTTDGAWAVVQQGLPEQDTGPNAGFARRYHWRSEPALDFVDEPHAAICATQRRDDVLSLVDHDNAPARQRSVELAGADPAWLARELAGARHLDLPAHHHVAGPGPDLSRFERVMGQVRDAAPSEYAALIALPGVGAKTLRALALLGELVYGTPVTFRDPAKFSFAHGGKDGHPFPVDRAVYDQSIETLRRAVQEARVGRTERLAAFKRLSALLS